MKYLCIHGHFYQPPRENAWLEEIETQDSAAPYHDWNARICAECYGPNALARVLNAKGELTDLVDNYAHISFNFGPTLLSWMQAHAPQVYRAVLESDKQSVENFSGHGSAIAQVYNHMIMPLANARDKETQVKWGLADFKARFGREPEAMWLAETACDTPTLEVLAAHGMKYVILAPGQCARVRKIGEKNWTDTSGAKVDPKRAYLCNLPSGKKIALFFYDGPVSQGIAFSDTLKSGENFARRLMSTYSGGAEAQLMHIATDGETYGHHQKFADMALAYCLKYVQGLPDVHLTVYGEFFENFPPQYEAQIFEDSSWSCFHGGERWRADCGCNSGGHPGWNQKWRAPLRKALDFIRDEMAKDFDARGREYFKDPWAARNDYIELVLDRGLDAQHKFFLRHATETAWRDRSTALMLLEMQRNAMLMYTSCGWFFDEISGLETVQILQYAARALELKRKTGGADIEPEFMRMLQAAPSNIKDLKNGAVVYERFVKPSAMPATKVAVQLVLQDLPGEEAAPSGAYVCDVSDYRCERVHESGGHLCYGSMKLKNRVTLEEDEVAFAVCQSHDTRLTCGASSARDINAAETFDALTRAARQGGFDAAHEEIRKRFQDIYPFTSLFKDAQRRVIDHVLEAISQKTDEEFTRIFEQQYPAVRGLKYIGAPLPQAFTTVADFVLTADIKAELARDPVDINALEELMDDVRTLGLQTDKAQVNAAAGEKLMQYVRDFCQDPAALPAAVKTVEFLNYMEIFGFTPDTSQAQQQVFKALQSLPAEERGKSILTALARKLKIAV